jgi:hypothetical protein
LSSKGQRAAAMGDLGWEASTANTDSGALTLLGEMPGTIPSDESSPG